MSEINNQETDSFEKILRGAKDGKSIRFLGSIGWQAAVYRRQKNRWQVYKHSEDYSSSWWRQLSAREAIMLVNSIMDSSSFFSVINQDSHQSTQ